MMVLKKRPEGFMQAYNQGSSTTKEFSEVNKQEEITVSKLDVLRAMWHEKWHDSDKGEEEGDICSLLSAAQIGAMERAIVADNKNNFKASYKAMIDLPIDKRKYLPKELFKVVCLLGAQKIADCIIGGIKKQNSKFSYRNVFHHICASGNHAWALEVAKHLKEQKIGINPGAIGACGDNSQLKMELKKLFPEAAEQWSKECRKSLDKSGINNKYSV